jgi:hypothetical protein
MWLHVTAFSTFPFRRTGEGNFYQQQHHQHRRFFYHGKHFYSAATGTQGRSFSALLDPTSRDTLDVLFLLFRFFFLFSACFLLLFYRFFFSSWKFFAFSFRYEGRMLLFATRGMHQRDRNTNKTQNQQTHRNISHKNCREDSMQVSCCFYLQTNSLSLSLHLRVHFSFS